MKYSEAFLAVLFVKGGLRLQERKGDCRFSVQSGPGTCSRSLLFVR